ncbi:MAG: hypothetical protein COZ75_04100 [Flavobacteriaceae bacterium CG_4_8_14_3_um_filter_34_10]|nr:T9SS type A sorting domain-containing protein [Flavobacteriia bacterium]PIX09955.1 MAG: hypothetical protein COZ75_04100 [Flavobacteriaceae bacterium CG_4_8_14_3_um_filter_34_10]
MKKITFLLFSALISFGISAQDMVLTGAFDGPLPGGLPKAVEIYVINDIADLSTYGFGSANNGGGTDGIEFVMSGSATAGSYLYIGTEDIEFLNYFGIPPTFVSGAASINGDDALELFDNVVDTGGGVFTGNVIDTFGDINLSGTGQPWEYLDGWAYRNDNTGPDGVTFVLASWTFSGINANDNETSNSTAASPWPLGTYVRALSVSDNDLNGFSMYPNPTSTGVVTIQTKNNQPLQVAVFDVLGKKVIAKQLTNNTLNVSSLKAGIYLVQVTDNKSTTTKKLIIK